MSLLSLDYEIWRASGWKENGVKNIPCQRTALLAVGLRLLAIFDRLTPNPAGFAAIWACRAAAVMEDGRAFLTASMQWSGRSIYSQWCETIWYCERIRLQTKSSQIQETNKFRLETYDSTLLHVHLTTIVEREWIRTQKCMLCISPAETKCSSVNSEIRLSFLLFSFSSPRLCRGEIRNSVTRCANGKLIN